MTVSGLAATVEAAVKQNNTCDVYESYFAAPATAAAAAGAGVSAMAGAGAGAGAPATAAAALGGDLDFSSEPPSAKGLAVFRDPSPTKRTATSVNWHPEGNRIAVAYSILRFQDERMMSGRLPTSSYIWDVLYPNHPLQGEGDARGSGARPSPCQCVRPARLSRTPQSWRCPAPSSPCGTTSRPPISSLGAVTTGWYAYSTPRGHGAACWRCDGSIYARA